MPAFDAYVFVDWSAKGSPSPARPSRDAIWLGELVPGAGAGAAERYHRTRAACFDDLSGRLRALVEGGLRVLVGCDFAYGYPRGLADALALGATTAAWARTWRALAARIEDTPTNASNRFAVAASLNEALMAGPRPVGPFWGCPAACASATLRPSKRDGDLTYPFATRSGHRLDEWRHTDLRARSTHPTVQPPWKLFTSGSVGSQTLLGIPYVARLRDDPTLAPFSRVWPFETGFTAEPAPATGPFIVHAEIWPVLVDDEVAAHRASDDRLQIRDQAQVRALCRWAAREDAAGRLGPLFDRPAGLSAEAARDCLEEEGWILGVR